MRTLEKPHLYTLLEIWEPRYHDSSVLLKQKAVDKATGMIRIQFTRAKSREGLKYCILKKVAQSFPVGTNGKIPCYVVPLDRLEQYESKPYD